MQTASANILSLAHGLPVVAAQRYLPEDPDQLHTLKSQMPAARAGGSLSISVSDSEVVLRDNPARVIRQAAMNAPARDPRRAVEAGEAAAAAAPAAVEAELYGSHTRPRYEPNLVFG